MSNKRESMLKGLGNFLQDKFKSVGIFINPGKNRETGELYYTISGIEISIDYNSRTRRFEISRLVDDKPVKSYTYELDGVEKNIYHYVWSDFIQPSLQEFQRSKTT